MEKNVNFTRTLITALSVFLFTGIIYGQDPLRFRGEVEEIITRQSTSPKKNAMLFTGSSSVRMWKDLSSAFPGYNTINTGFGGSSMSELFYYTQELVINFKPKKIFIYEGDNDIASGKTPDQILADAQKVLNYIRGQLPKKTKVYFISAKPSVSRWKLKTEYETFNQLLKGWVEKQKNVEFIDVWNPMLGADGNVKPDLFIEDQLHMNKKGYDIWTSVLKPYLK